MKTQITEKLPQDIKEKWITALKSGKYIQTKNHLHDKYGYCCLGVLAVECGVPAEIIDKHDVLVEGMVEYGIPQMLIGTPYQKPETIGEITVMNDGDTHIDEESGEEVQIEARTFSQIADWIQENL